MTKKSLFIIDNDKQGSHHHNPYQALSTLPDLRHDVHTYIFFEPPSVLTRTDFTLDFHILLDLLCE